MGVFVMLDKVFGNSGAKIKLIAAILFVLQVIFGFLSAAVSFISFAADLDGLANEYGPFALILLFFGPVLIVIATILVAFLDTLLLYAFGEIVDAACVYLALHTDSDEPMMPSNAAGASKKTVYHKVNGKKMAFTPDGEMLCPHCWKKLPSQGVAECPHCGQKI